jgi:hypothetical protein
MAEILFPTQSCTAENLVGQGNLDDFILANPLARRGTIQAYQPYWLPDQDPMGALSLSMLSGLSGKAKVKLAQAADQMGDATIAISEFYNQNFLNSTVSDWQSVTGAGMGAMATRTNNFIGLLEQYQAKLMEISRAAKSKAPRAQVSMLEKQAKQLLSSLNGKFKSEMKHFVTKTQSSRGTPMTNAQRAINIAKSSRTTRSLQVADLQQARNLAKFANGLQRVGKGLVVLDVASRVGTVLDAKDKGQNWQKLAAQETTGMSLGIAAGSIASTVVIGSLTIALAATPVGWVIAIGVGLTVGVAAGMAGNSVGKGLSGMVYDLSDDASWF